MRKTYRGKKITKADYHKMLVAQNFLCAICYGEEQRRDKVGRLLSLSIDHDHCTGKVRALLCNACNLAIGHVEKNTRNKNEAIKVLRSMINYLNTYNGAV